MSELIKKRRKYKKPAMRLFSAKWISLFILTMAALKALFELLSVLVLALS